MKGKKHWKHYYYWLILILTVISMKDFPVGEQHPMCRVTGKNGRYFWTLG